MAFVGNPSPQEPLPLAGRASREQLPVPWGCRGGCWDGPVGELRARTALLLLLQPEISCLVLCNSPVPHSFFLPLPHCPQIHYFSSLVTRRHPGKTAFKKQLQLWGRGKDTKKPGDIKSLLSYFPFSLSTHPMMEVFLLRQCSLLPPVLQHRSKAWLAFKSLLTNPGISALCQTPKSGLQRKK